MAARTDDGCGGRGQLRKLALVWWNKTMDKVVVVAVHHGWLDAGLS